MAQKFKTKRIACNPLVPEYKLQTYNHVAPPVPKFIRDHLKIDDIEGAKPKEKRELAQRDFYSVQDIAGARPKS